MTAVKLFPYLVAVALAVGTLAPSAASQTGACLHGANASPQDARRQQDAVTALRSINTEFMRQLYKGAPRQSPVVGIPDGFELELAGDATKYVALLRDAKDPCGFALATSGKGLIYTAEPLR